MPEYRINADLTPTPKADGRRDGGSLPLDNVRATLYGETMGGAVADFENRAAHDGYTVRTLYITQV